MSAASTPEPIVQRTGPLRVDTSVAVVRAFRREIGWAQEEGPVPVSFPVVWMREPQIGEPIRAAAQQVGLPVHEAQHFDVIRPLQLATTYHLMLELRRESAPARLIATADISTLDGAPVARVVSTMRLIDPAQAPRPSDAPDATEAP